MNFRTYILVVLIHFYKNFHTDKNKYADLSAKISALDCSDHLKELCVDFKYATELTSADALVYGKSLASIEKKLHRIADKEGPYSTPAEYIMRLCRVLKVKGYFYTSPDSMRRDTYIDGTRTLRAVIDRFTENQDQKRKLKMQAA